MTEQEEKYIEALNKLQPSEKQKFTAKSIRYNEETHYYEITVSTVIFMSSHELEYKLKQTNLL